MISTYSPMICGRTKHGVVFLLVTFGFFRVNSAYLAQSRGDGLTSNASYLSPSTENPNHIESKNSSSEQMSQDPEDIFNLTPTEAKKENTKVPGFRKSDCDDLLVTECMSRNCSWTKGKCTMSSADFAQQAQQWPSEASFSKMLTNFSENLEQMWHNPPSDTNAILWQTFLGCTIAFVTLIIVVGVPYCTWRGIRYCKRRRVQEEEDINSNGESSPSPNSKRLVLLLPQGRKINVKEVVFDCTGIKPRTILLHKSGPDYVRGSSITGNMNDAMPCSSNSSLANMYNVSESSTKLPRRRSSPDTGHSSGHGCSNEAFTMSSSSESLTDFQNHQNSDTRDSHAYNPNVHYIMEDDEDESTPELTRQLPGPSTSLYRPSENKAEVELKSVKEENEQEVEENEEKVEESQF